MKTNPDDLSDLTWDEQSAFHSIRKRVAEFQIRLIRKAQRLGELPTARERTRRILNAGFARDFAPSR